MSLLLFSNTTIEENENIFKNDKESSMTLNIIDSFNNVNKLIFF